MSKLQTYIVHRTHLRSPDTLSSSIDMSESKCVVLADEADAEIARLKEDRDLWKQSENDCAKHNRELVEQVGNLKIALAQAAKRQHTEKSAEGLRHGEEI